MGRDTSKGRQAFVVVDLGYGDAGKGTMTDWLCRRHDAHTVVRFNGGGQAAHNVVTDDGRHHTFSHFGSGTFVPGVRTHLTEDVVVSPLALMAEADVLRGKGESDALARMSIHEDARVITPFHRAVNRLREMSRSRGRHGSCGIGFGETVRDYLGHPDERIAAKHLRDRDALHDLLVVAWSRMRAELGPLRGELPDTQEARELLALLETYDSTFIEFIVEGFLACGSAVSIADDGEYERMFAQDGTIVFEGAQGVLLDEWHGFHPYTTWSTCTPKHAMDLLNGSSGTSFNGAVERIGVTRAYATRHGAGPFVTEDAELASALAEPHNGDDEWQGTFRVGHLDLVALRYAIEVCEGIDALAVTCLDVMRNLDEWRVCDAYEGCHPNDRSFFHFGRGRVTDVHMLPVDERFVAHERRTASLEGLTPVLERTATGCRKGNRCVTAHLRRIADALEVPVRYSSHGPTAADKGERGIWPSGA